MRSVRSALVVMLAAVVLVGCGGGGDSATTTTKAPTTTTTEPPRSPLTGTVPADPATLDRPALVIKVDTTPKGRARQAGVQFADLVYVEQVEGGVTRLITVFQSRDADAVGPVRSARDTDLAVLAPITTPLFAFSGGAPVLPRVYVADLTEVGYPHHRGIYEQRGSGVYRLFLPTANAYALAPDDAAPPAPLFTYGSAATGEPTGGVNLSYGRARSAWEVEGDHFVRSQDGTPHMVEDVRIAATNVIVQFVGYEDTGIRDTAGAASPKAIMVGEGDVWILSGGKLVAGRWHRAAVTDITTYTDAAGAPIPLLPGTTWVELVPPGGGAQVPPPTPAA